MAIPSSWVVRDNGSLFKSCNLSSKYKTKFRSKSSLLNSCNLSAKYKTKSRFKSRSKSSLLNSCTDISAKSKTNFKTKSKSKYSDSSKALGNAESKLIKSANAQPKCMFLLRQEHKETHDYCVISTEGNSFRVLDEDDDDLPRNLLPLLTAENSSIPWSHKSYVVLESCGSLILLLFKPIHSKPQYLVWDMEMDTCRYRFPLVSPGREDEDLWACGLGFDPSSGHYKLVVCWTDYFDNVYAEMLSLGTGLWKAVHYPFDFFISPTRFPSIHINGFCYWIAAGFRDRSVAIMSFDFARERFGALIPLLEGEKVMSFSNLSVVLVEFQGSLAVVCCNSSKDINPFIFEIWAWNARGRFWSLVSTFDIPAAAHPRAVLNLYNNDKLFFEDFKGDLLLYDLATRRQENLGRTFDGRDFWFFPYVKICVGPCRKG
ncbi:F-box family protein [Striga asiatica]|uniref:F-box family protein n=1 Tax=Striga asiatica TaxID=4170 RepID=A0A5A7P3J7_STRAF|nr:F-box family protein [Striga asiatica]